MESQKELDTKLLASFLQRTYRDNKPASLLEAEVISSARTGDNYGSDIVRVKMKFINGSGKIKCRSMIVKKERDWSAMGEFMHSFPLFRIEVKMYSNIFTLMEDLVDEFDDKREKLWPTIYGFIPYNLIAFEDLKESEYIVADRKKSLDLNHAKLVLRSLARFHAMGKVLIGRNLITKEDKGSYLHVEEGGVIQKMWSSLLLVFSDAIRDSWGEEWYELSENLRKIEKRVAWKIQDLANVYDSRFEVMAHSDAWLCNMMFRYLEHENIPVSVKLIDFQTSFATSFMWDVAYFMTTSVVPSIRRENTVKLLEVYQESLSENLKFFNYSGYIPTLDDVKSEWERLKFTHILCFGLHVLMSSDVPDVFDPSKVMTHAPHEVYNVKAYADEKIKLTIGEDLKRYREEGIF